MADFSAIKRIINDWQATGSQPQPGMSWTPEPWLALLPDFRKCIDEIPPSIDRSFATQVGSKASLSSREAAEAFIVTMIWGYGQVGYGAWRVRRIFDLNPAIGERLQTVAEAVKKNGACSAYQLLSSECRVQRLGPAFGTKFLYFCSSQSQEEPALILDSVVANWIREHLNIQFDSAIWNPVTYAEYLALMRVASQQLGCDMGTIEMCIFDSVRR